MQSALLRSFVNKAQTLLGLISVCVLTLLLSVNPASAAATINNQISYQAKLMDPSGFPVADGNYSIILSLYNAPSAGTRLWTASGTTGAPTAISVSVVNGLFTVLLGDTGQNTLDTVDWNSDALYLGVTIGADAEMTPRRRMAAAPQAFNARQLQGMYASGTAFGTSNLFAINQTSNTAATGTRAALEVRSSGTSDANDFLIRGINDLGSAVFSVNRQGNVTSTGVIAANMVTTSQLYVAGSLVCLSNGTNCSGSGSSTDSNWIYNLASDFVRNATATTDIVLGSNATSTGAPVYFDLSGGTTGTSTAYFGNATNTNVVIGGTSTTDTGLGNAFVMNGDDLFVHGNIGSASSVYSNGDFVTGGTTYGNGAINKTDGNMFIQSSGHLILTSVGGGKTFVGTVGSSGVSMADITFNGLTYSSFLWNANNAYDIGSNVSSTRNIYASGTVWGGIGVFNTLFSSSTHLVNVTSTALDTAFLNAVSGTLATLNANTGNFGSIDVAGNATIHGNTFLGDNSSADQVFFTSTVNSDVNPTLNDTYTLGQLGQAWRGFFSSVTTTNLSVNGSTVCLTNGTNCPATSSTSTLQDVTNNGATTTREVYLLGGSISSSSTVTSSLTVLNNFNFTSATTASSFKIGMPVPTIDGQSSVAFSVSSTNLASGLRAGTTNISGFIAPFIDFAQDLNSLPFTTSGATMYYVTSTNALSLFVHGQNGIAATTFSLRDLNASNTASNQAAAQLINDATNSSTAMLRLVNNAAAASIVQHVGTGSPEGSVYANIGSIYFNDAAVGTSGTQAYLKTQAHNSTGWVGIATTDMLAGLGSGTTTDLNWSYNIANDSVRNATATTDIFLGSSATSTGAPAYFDLSGGTNGTSTFYFGHATNTNVVIGGTSSSVGFMSPQFALNGNDLFVGGNIGSVSSVYTNGAFVAGTGTTMFGDGFINKTNGKLTLTASQNIVAASRLDALYLNRWFESPLLNNSVYGAGKATTTVGTNPAGLAFDGAYLWVANSGSNTVSKVDVTTNAVVATTAVGTAPFDAAFDGTYMWVVNNGTNNVSKVDVTTNAVVATTTVGASPQSIAFDGSFMWVVNGGSANVSKINVSTNAVVATTTVGSSPFLIAFDGSSMWVANSASNNVSKINVSTNAVVATTTVGSFPIGLVFDGSHMWVANGGSNTISKIDVNTNNVVATTTVGTNPGGMAFDGTDIWVTNSGSNNISKVDIKTNGVLATLPVGTFPVTAAFDGSHIWVANFNSNNLTKLPIGGGNGTDMNFNVTINAAGNVNVSGTETVANGINQLWSADTHPRKLSSATISASARPGLAVGSYEYVPDGNFLLVFDISNPNQVDLVSSLNLGQTITSGIGYDAHTVYLLGGANTMFYVDVTDPAAPFVRSSFTKPTGLTAGFTVSNGYLYGTRFGAFGDDDTLVIFKIHPTSLEELGSLVDSVTAGVMTVVGNYLYSPGGDGLNVVEIFDPRAPDIYGNLDLSATTPNFTDLAVSGRYVYLTDSFNNQLLTVDVSDPSFPVAVQTLSGFTSPRTISVSGRYAYVTDSAGVIRVADVQTTSSQSIVNSIQTDTDALGNVNVLGRYAFVEQTGSTNRGLAAYDFRGTEIANLTAHSLEAGDLSVKGKATFADSVKILSSLAVGDYLTVAGQFVCLADGTNCDSSRLWNGSRSARELSRADASTNSKDHMVIGEYAYVIDNKAIDVYDVSDPNAVALITSLNLGTAITDMDYDGNTLYAMAGFSLKEISLAKPAAPVVISTVVSFDGIKKFRAVDGYLYASVCSGFCPSGNAFNVYQVTTSSLTLVGSVADVADSQTRPWIRGHYAFTVNPSDLNFYVTDISDPTTPTVIGSLDLSGTTPFFLDLVADDRYAYLTDDNNGVLFKLDLADPTTPFTIVALPGFTDPAFMTLNGRYLYLSDVGTHVYDVFDVQASTTPSIVGGIVANSDSIYRMIPVGNYGIAVEPDSVAPHLAAYDLDGVEISNLTAHSLAASDLRVTGNAQFANAAQVQGSLAVGHDLTVGGQHVCLANGTNCQSITLPASVTVAPVSNATGSLSNPYDVAVQGKYMYVTDNAARELAIFDISDAQNPVETATTSLSFGSAPLQIFVKGNFAYVTIGSTSNTLDIVDVSDPFNPILVGVQGFGVNAPSGVYVDGNYAYVANGTSNLTVVNVSTPSAPVSVATTTVGTFPTEVVVNDHHAYVTNFGSDDMSIVDVTNPLSPSLIATQSSLFQPGGLAVSNGYAYVANSQFANDTLSIIDVHDPASPSIVTSTFAGQGALTLAVAGHYAYVGNPHSGGTFISVIDITDPLHPVYVSQNNIGFGPNNIAVSGQYLYSANFSFQQTVTIAKITGDDTTDLFAVKGYINTLAVAHDLTVTGKLVCLADGTNCPVTSSTSTLQDVSNNGATTTRELYLLGGSISSSSTVTSSLSVLGSMSFNPSTGTNPFAIHLQSTTSFTGSFDYGLTISTTNTNAGMSMFRLNDGTNDVTGMGFLDNVTNPNASGTLFAYNHNKNQFSIDLLDASGLSANAAEFAIRNLDSGIASQPSAFRFQNSSAVSSTAVADFKNNFAGGDVVLHVGNNTSPEGTVFANAGSIYFNDHATAQGTQAYLKTTNNNSTGWAGIVTTDMLASSMSLQQVTNIGATTSNMLTLYGGFMAGSSTVTSTLTALGRLDALNLNRWFLSPLLNQTINQGGSTTVAIGTSPTGVAFDGSHIWVTNNGSNNVSKIDVNTNTVVATTTVGVGPRGIAFDGRFIWVANSNASTVSKINIYTNAVVDTVGVGITPNGVTYANGFIWVANQFSSTVSKIDVSSDAVVDTITVDTAPNSIAFDGDFLWTANQSANTLSKIDVRSDAVVATIPVGQFPNSLAFDGSHIWATNGNDNTVSKVNINTNAVVATTTVGGFPDATVFDGNHIWIANQSDKTVSMIDINTNAVVLTKSTGLAPTGLAFDGSHLWAANLNSNSASKIEIGGGSGANENFHVNLVPDADLTYSLGSLTKRFNAYLGSVTATNLYVSSTFNAPGSLTSNQTITAVSSTSIVFGPLADAKQILVRGNIAYVLSDSAFGGQDLVNIFDISNPAYPTSTPFSGGPLLDTDHIEVAGDFIFAANTTTNVIQRLDTRHSNHGYRTTYSLPGVVRVKVVGSYLYAQASNPDLTIYEINGNGDLKLVGSGEFGGAGIPSLDVQGSYAFIQNGIASERMIDVSDPAHPFQTALFPGILGGVQVVQGSYLYSVGNIANNTGGASMDIYSILNPDAPFLVTSTYIGATTTNLYVAGNYAFTATSSGRVFVFDVSDPTAPVKHVLTTTAGTENLSGVVLQGHYLLASDSTNGRLVTFDVGGIQTTAVSAASGDFGNLNVRKTATFGQSLDVIGGLVVGRNGISSNGGISALGSISVGATNTTSVIMGGLMLTTSSTNATGTDNWQTVINYTSSTSFGGLCLDDNSNANSCPSSGFGGASIVADGVIASNAFDLAETYSVNGGANPGDVLVLDGTASATVKVATGIPYDPKVIGVVSTDPGLLLGWNQGARVALTGHVPTHVNMENGPIHVGDALTTSHVPGEAMKATKAGMIIGYALEDVNATGSADVFVAVGYSAGLVLGNDGALTTISDDVLMGPRVAASSTNVTADSWGLTFRGQAWDASSTSVVNRDFTLMTDVISATSSAFAIQNASGTDIFSIDENGNAAVNGDLQVGGKLYLSSRGSKQNDYYVFLDQTGSSTYIGTNADGFQSLDTYDFAERFYSPDALEPGDLVVVKTHEGGQHVQRSFNENDMLVGIVSTRPAFVAGRPATDTYPIALTGRVPTKVSNMSGAIKAGDALAPSNMPGVAVKATKTGPIVGLALEDFDESQINKINVYVNPGWWTASSTPDQVINQTVINNTTVTSSDSGMQRRGLAKIEAGSTQVHVTFDTLNAYPFVQVTPRGLITGAWGTDAYTDHGFDILLSQPQSFDAYFSWQAEALDNNDRLYQSDGTYLDLNQMTGEPVGGQAPTSSESVVTSTDSGTSTSTTSSTEPVVDTTSTIEIVPSEPPADTSTSSSSPLMDDSTSSTTSTN